MKKDTKNIWYSMISTVFYEKNIMYLFHSNTNKLFRFNQRRTRVGADGAERPTITASHPV